MRHKFLILTVKKWLKSVYRYGSYRKIKTGVPLFLDHSVYIYGAGAGSCVGPTDFLVKIIGLVSGALKIDRALDPLVDVTNTYMIAMIAYVDAASIE